MDEKGSGGPTLRYMMDEGKGGGMLRGMTGLVIVIIIFGAAFGLALGASDLLNPATSSAKAARMNQETAALTAKSSYEQDLRQIDLEKQRALAQKELAWYDRKVALMEDAATVLGLGLFVGAIGLGLGGGIYLASLGFDVLRRRRPLPQAIESGRGKILPFPPNPVQRPRRQPQHLPEGAT